MRVQTVLNLLFAIKEGYLSELDVIFFVNPFGARDQPLQSTSEIRNHWFDHNLINRSIEINRPVWIEQAVTKREIVLHRDPKPMVALVARVRSYVLHQRERNDQTGILAPPDLPEASHQWLTAQSKRLRKASRKQAVLERLTNPANATTRAIERFAFLTRDRQIRTVRPNYGTVVLMKQRHPEPNDRS